MKELIETRGFIIKSTPIKDYDRRVVLITDSLGKITAFVRGARKQGSVFMGSTDIFSFGKFRLYPGKEAYNIREADIEEYFAGLRKDYEASVLGSYFCEIADYYCRENNEELDMLRLLYVSFKALEGEGIPKELIRAVFELKSIMVNGEYPGILEDNKLLPGTLKAIRYVEEQPFKSLFAFKLSNEVLLEFCKFANRICRITFDRSFKSESFL